MASNITKTILEQENETAEDASASPDLAIPLPEEVLALHEREKRKEQIEAFRLRGTPRKPGPDDWKKTVGMFKDDPIMKETAEEGRRIRANKTLNELRGTLLSKGATRDGMLAELRRMREVSTE